MAESELRRCYNNKNDNVQNEFLQEENEILKQKLEIHMNLWDLDKQQMESDFFAAMQVHKRKASAQTYEKAKLKVSHGLQQQQEFVMKLKLEAALENVEVLQTKVKFLTALLQDSKGGRGTTTMTTEQRRCIQVVETSKENDTDEAKQRIEHLEQSLKAAIEIHKLEVEALRAESLAEATEKETQQREITKLKEKLCQCQKQRKKLAQWLVNESSFLHGQLKNMEAIHSGRLCHKEKQLEVASRTIEQLQRSLDEVQQMRDESGFQDTILRSERKQLEESTAMEEAVAECTISARETSQSQELLVGIQKQTADNRRIVAELETSKQMLKILSSEKEVLRNQLNSTSAELQEVKIKMVDSAILAASLQASSLSLETLSLEKEALQNQLKCTSAELQEVKSKMMDAEILAASLQTSSHVVESLSLEKETLQSQLELALAELQETKNKVADSQTMAKSLSLALESFSLEKKAQQNQLNSTTVELQDMKRKMADFESAAGNLRNSRHQVRSLDLENKSLRSQLELANEELEKVNCRMADTKRLVEDSENLALQKMALETQLKLTSKELQEERQAVHNAQKQSQEECAHALTLLKEKEAALKEGISVLEDLRQENKSLRMQLSDLQQEIKENEVVKKADTHSKKTRSRNLRGELDLGALSTARATQVLSDGSNFQDAPLTRSRASKERNKVMDSPEQLQDINGSSLERQKKKQSLGPRRSLGARRQSMNSAGFVTPGVTIGVGAAQLNTEGKSADNQPSGEAETNENNLKSLYSTSMAQKRPPLPPVSGTSKTKRQRVSSSRGRKSGASHLTEDSLLGPAQLLIASYSQVPRTNIFSTAFTIPRLKPSGGTSSPGSSVRVHR
ncbi:unnamed protein product [Sphagnum troendelagicum]|uniref:Nuclear mitotic apparatus protein 1 n=1 Tax=Sphagnum troendelagicum TaxID=128251 RepID=A0ABP0UP06_9BRYO